MDRRQPPVPLDLDAPPLAGQAKCAEPGCPRGLWFTGRRRPRKCWEHCGHVPKWGANTDLRPVPDDIPKSADAAAKRASAKRIDEYLAAVGVASWSEVFGDARLAAMHLLGPDADELAIKRLTDRAKSDELKPVREAHTAYHARLAAHARTLSLLAAIKLTGSVPAQSIAMHTKLLHTIAEELGGSDAAFSELILELTIEEAA